MASPTTPAAAGADTTTTTVPAGHRPRWRWVVLGALAAVVLLLWLTGGLAGGATVRHERAGAQFSLGPVDLTVRDATAQHAYDGRWNVQVRATCQVTDQNAPDIGLLSEDLFSMASVSEPVLYSDHSVTRFDPSQDFGLERDYLGPGLASATCVFQATMPASYDPHQGIRVAFADLEFGDDSVTGNQDPHWHGGNGVHRLQLPVRVLADN